MLRPTEVVSRLAVAAALLTVVGCGARSARNLKLDKELAHNSLETCLKAWKSREKIESLTQLKPPMICRDSDWETGATLQDFKFVGVETDDGTNLHSAVELSMLDKYGREVRKSVKYVVGTSPSITVLREEE